MSRFHPLFLQARNALFALALSALLACAGESAPRWKPVAGLKNVERIFPSTVDAARVFVWTKQGLSHSKDGGTTFQPVPGGTALGRMTALLFHPVKTATLYAGTADKGVFVSTDEGATWSPLGTVERGLASARIHTLVFGPDDPSFTTIFATHSIKSPGISMTIDGGRHWRSFAKDYGAGDLIILGSTIFFAGARPAGGQETGFYRFDPDRGWFRVLSVENPTVLAPSKTETKRVWFGTAGGGLRVTRDFGVSSNEVGPPNANIVSLAVGFGAAPGSDAVFAYDPGGDGVLMSADNFQSSTKINDGLYVGDWVADGATMAASADGATLFASVNGGLFRCARAESSPEGLSAPRAEPAAVVAEQESVLFSCKAPAGATVTLDLSRLGGPAALLLSDDGKNGDSAAGDGVFSQRVAKVGLKVIPKERENQETPTGQVALPLTARAGDKTFSASLLLTVLKPAVNLILWDGESRLGEARNVFTTWSDGRLTIARSEEQPFSGRAHMRLDVQGAGQAGFSWRRGGSDDARSHKLLSFYVRSNTPGPSDLKLLLRDDGRNYGSINARRSNEVPLAQYLPEVGSDYRLVRIPLADFIFGSSTSQSALYDLVFVAPSAAPRVYDFDDLSLVVRPGPDLSGAAAAFTPASSEVKLSVRAASAGGGLEKIRAAVDGKEFQLAPDAKSAGMFSAKVPAVQLGAGLRTLHFLASDTDGDADLPLIAFIPAKPPGEIAREESAAKPDGKLDEFAAAAPFVVTAGDATLTARILYTSKELHFGFEIKDPKLQLKPVPKNQDNQALLAASLVEVLITSPTASALKPRTGALQPDDHRLGFALFEKQGWAVNPRNSRWSLAGAKTPDGCVMEAVVPLDALKSDGRFPCDFDGGKTTRIEFRLKSGSKPAAWSAATSDAANDPDNWGLAVFSGEPAPPKTAPAAIVVEQPPEKIDAATSAGIIVEKIGYMGWKDCLRLRNTTSEVVIVPQIGRVMHFALAGKENTFWVNRGIAGQSVLKDDGQWHNFGGDKVWPTQQSFWQKYTGKNGWPPPYHFDCAPAIVEPISGGVRMRTAQSPQFGASCVREFLLDAKKPLLRVRQWFDKTEGDPADMTVWSITQVRKPLYSLLPLGVPFNGKPFKSLGQTPLNFQILNGTMALQNDERAGQKAGAAADAAASNGWVAAVYDDVAILKSQRLRKEGVYPDGGCPIELYTSDNGNGGYVELELLSPLKEIKAGEKYANEEVWQLVPLTKEQSADAQSAATILKAAHKAAVEP